ncbi:amino acid permease [bacterium BD-1]|uniref:amino acid permease n=1 Tax=Arenimonas sp. TaxID=1872635 RepID=UPI001E34879A|nr:amino acid permease [Ottowia caeni]
MNDTKKIGFWTCTALVVGNTIGMGIFLLPASLAPFGLNALIGWVVVVLGCLALARVFAHLARELPQAEGPYGYVRSTLGELPAYVALWCYWVSLWITNAALATGVVGYLQAVFPELVVLHPSLCALVLLWVFVAINSAGVRSGGAVQIVTTGLKLLPMVAVAALGAWVLFTTPGEYVAHPPTPAITLGATMSAATIALFAMLGIESATVPASKVREPGITIPRATLVGTLVVAVIYLIVSTVPLLLIPEAQLAESSAPFALLMSLFGGDGSGRWLALFVVVSGLGALNGWTLLVGELTRTMAGHGVLPGFLAASNRAGAPGRALLVTGLLGSAMVLMSYSKTLVAGFTFLTTVVTAANLPLYACCSLALVVTWRRGGGIRTGMLVASVLALAFVVFAFVGMGREPFLWALVLAVAGLPLYAFLRLRPKKVAGHA